MSIVFKSGSLSLLEPSGPVQGCNGIALRFCWHNRQYPWLSRIYAQRPLVTTVMIDFLWKPTDLDSLEFIVRIVLDLELLFCERSHIHEKLLLPSSRPFVALSVRPSLLTYQLGSQCMELREKFYLEVFRKTCLCNKVVLKSGKNIWYFT